MALYQRFQRQFLSHLWLARTLVILSFILIAVGLFKFIFAPAYVDLNSLWSAYNLPLPNTDGRVNFLILGFGGQGDNRDGNLLTDSMIFASVDEKTGDVGIISVPRDIWVPSMQAKINTAYYYGEQKQPNGGGLVLAKSSISEVLGQPVHFSAIIDFSSFEKFIDLLGGVDVMVDHSFTDTQYPITGKENDICNGDPTFACRYETIQFSAGPVHMDGATALKFARSRHAQGDEGTDFARSARQEKIIAAVRTKLLTRQVLTNKNLLLALYNTFQKSVINDVDKKYYLPLVKLGLTVGKHPFRTTSISELFYNPAISSLYDLQWVLVPKKENLVTTYVKDFLSVKIQN